MSFFNTEQQNALLEVRNELRRAIESNDARSVDYFHTFLELIESQELVKFLQQMNQPALANLINYLNEKISYLIETLSTFHDITYRVN